MVYDENLADQVRAALGVGAHVTERKMFGGLTFMLNGHMCCGIVKDALMLRLGPDGAELALDRPHVRPMDFTGRPMKAMVLVDPPGLDGPVLQDWVDKAAAFTGLLPDKPAG